MCGLYKSALNCGLKKTVEESKRQNKNKQKKPS